MKDGQPINNQYVLAGREVKARESPPLSARTDEKGIARIKLNGTGKWYVKFIHMTPHNGQQIDYESKWATLTFELR